MTAEKISDHRPLQPIRQERREFKLFIGTALGLFFVIYWILLPIWPNIDTHILGDSGTDAIRGMWGFYYLSTTVIPPQTPIYSNIINFPSGSLLLILPFVSGIIFAPINWIFGPIIGWNLSIAALLWGYGMTTAILCRQMTKSWSVGFFVGSAVVSQPMLLHAMSDGTAEHLSLWLMPLFLTFLWKSLQTITIKWSLFAGIFAFFIALDSPYHAIYAGIAAITVIPFNIVEKITTHKKDFKWLVGILIAISSMGALLLIGIYQFFPIKTLLVTEKISLLTMNTTDIRTWWQHDVQDVFMRDESLPPTTIPSVLLLIAVILILVGIPNSLPWFVLGVFMLLLSVGLNNRVPVHLGQWFGEYGKNIGIYIIELNRYLYNIPGIGSIRFPQRWLVPASFMLLVGSSFGLERIYQSKRVYPFRFIISGVLTIICTVLCLRNSRLDLNFPMQELPKIEFAEYLAQKKNGGVLLLPQMRPPPKSGKRSDLPIFANLSSQLASSDNQYFQVIHQKPIFTKPNLKTISSFDQDENVARLVRNWDDMANPKLTGEPIPPSAYDPRSQGIRQDGLNKLVDAGLQWIVLDLAAYNDEAKAYIKEQIGIHYKSDQRFDDGDGVLVIELQ